MRRCLLSISFVAASACGAPSTPSASYSAPTAIAPSAAPVVASGSPAPNDPSAAEIVARAIAAQQPDGVKDRPGWCMKYRSRMQGPAGTTSFSLNECQRGSDRVRMEILEPEQLAGLYTDDGREAWQRTPSGIRAVGADERADLRKYQYVDWASALWPLREPGYRLTSLGRRDVRGAQTLGVLVSRDAELDLELYVDEATWLVVKRGLHHEGALHRTEYDETFLSEWRTANGVRYASHGEKLRDGSPRAEWDIQMTYPDELSDDLFRKPSP